MSCLIAVNCKVKKCDVIILFNLKQNFNGFENKMLDIVDISKVESFSTSK